MNISWHIYPADSQPPPKLAYEGNKSLAINFHMQEGWLSFYHYPNTLTFGRYKALEFYILYNDLKNDQLITAIYADNKEKYRYPSEDWLHVSNQYNCKDPSDTSPWVCIYIPLSDYEYPYPMFYAIAIGKASGQDEGIFYIDNMQLIEK